MKLIELHILQSFPVSCLNRDDLGSPKSAMFGGVQRARVSSQSWKRAIRLLAQEKQEYFGGVRSRFIIRELERQFLEKGLNPEESHELAVASADAVGKLDSEEKGNVKTLLYFSPGEFKNLVEFVMKTDHEKELQKVIKHREDKKKKEISRKDLLNKIQKPIKKSFKDKVRDAADIAIFGRMVADDHSLMVEGAGLFSHALSTHKSSNEIDFFSAVDDLNIEGDEGAGHIGNIEFNSACYYRYVGLNVDMLKDNDHLGHFDDQELGKVVKAFIESSLLAVPNARKNSMFGFTPPSFVLALVREGQPLSLANAFENPVTSRENGYIRKSQESLEEHWKTIKETFGFESIKELTLPEDNMKRIVEELTQEASK